MGDGIDAAYLQPDVQGAAQGLGALVHLLLRGRTEVQAADVEIQQGTEGHAVARRKRMAQRHQHRQLTAAVGLAGQPVPELRRHEDAHVGA